MSRPLFSMTLFKTVPYIFGFKIEKDVDYGLGRGTF